MADQVAVRLQGGEAELGRVPAVDVARLLIGFERAVARAAERIVGRRPGLSGRRGAAVEATTRLRLVAVRSGSVMPVLTLPEPTIGDGELQLDDLHLGSLALDAAMDVLLGSSQQPEVAEAFVALADEVGIGSRYEQLTFVATRNTDERTATLDRSARERLRLVATGGTSAAEDAIVGTLVEADFERRTARLRTSGRRVVNVSFSDDLADTIQEVLRRQSELVGIVEFDEGSGEALRIVVREVVQTAQLLLGVDPNEFWRHHTVEDLLAQRSTGVATSASAIRDAEASDEEIDAFLGALSSDDA